MPLLDRRLDQRPLPSYYEQQQPLVAVSFMDVSLPAHRQSTLYPDRGLSKLYKPSRRVRQGARYWVGTKSPPDTLAELIHRVYYSIQEHTF